jgi:hypothetical protein
VRAPAKIRHPQYDAMTTAPSKADVEILTASWCKRCKDIKPGVQSTCAITGATYREVDYDELDDADPVKIAVKALPTIRVRMTGETFWRVFVPAELDVWRDFMMNRVAFSTVPSDSADLDF